ncbi:collagen alpha-1(II) chain-like [Perognathus longimembris pacificus]|uniref:collagen alpha-1(II) chain-like n=1 Tax=Perognathus longimembris pacificus TaxID=214514 RepID=UPI0020186413|nr:collagen alpha-1(II) chain-like [Perognathus longimembris pacificus]
MVLSPQRDPNLKSDREDVREGHSGEPGHGPGPRGTQVPPDTGPQDTVEWRARPRGLLLIVEPSVSLGPRTGRLLGPGGHGQRGAEGRWGPSVPEGPGTGKQPEAPWYRENDGSFSLLGPAFPPKGQKTGAWEAAGSRGDGRPFSEPSRGSGGPAQRTDSLVHPLTPEPPGTGLLEPDGWREEGPRPAPPAQDLPSSPPDPTPGALQAGGPGPAPLRWWQDVSEDRDGSCHPTTGPAGRTVLSGSSRQHRPAGREAGRQGGGSVPQPGAGGELSAPPGTPAAPGQPGERRPDCPSPLACWETGLLAPEARGSGGPGVRGQAEPLSSGRPPARWPGLLSAPLDQGRLKPGRWPQSWSFIRAAEGVHARLASCSCWTRDAVRAAAGHRHPLLGAQLAPRVCWADLDRLLGGTLPRCPAAPLPPLPSVGVPLCPALEESAAGPRRPQIPGVAPTALAAARAPAAATSGTLFVSGRERKRKEDRHRQSRTGDGARGAAASVPEPPAPPCAEDGVESEEDLVWPAGAAAGAGAPGACRAGGGSGPRGLRRVLASLTVAQKPQAQAPWGCPGCPGTPPRGLPWHTAPGAALAYRWRIQGADYAGDTEGLTTAGHAPSPLGSVPSRGPASPLTGEPGGSGQAADRRLPPQGAAAQLTEARQVPPRLLSEGVDGQRQDGGGRGSPSPPGRREQPGLACSWPPASEALRPGGGGGGPLGRLGPRGCPLCARPGLRRQREARGLRVGPTAAGRSPWRRLGLGRAITLGLRTAPGARGPEIHAAAAGARLRPALQGGPAGGAPADGSPQRRGGAPGLAARLGHGSLRAEGPVSSRGRWRGLGRRRKQEAVGREPALGGCRLLSFQHPGLKLRGLTLPPTWTGQRAATSDPARVAADRAARAGGCPGPRPPALGPRRRWAPGGSLDL